MIDGRNFFGQPVGNNMKTYENIWKNTIVQDDYTTGCLLDYPYFKEDYKLNATDLSKHQALDPNQKAIQQITSWKSWSTRRCMEGFSSRRTKRNHFRFFTITVKIL